MPSSGQLEGDPAIEVKNHQVSFLRPYFNPGSTHGVLAILTRLSRNVFSSLGATLDVVKVPGLVETAVLAVEGDLEAVLLGYRGLDLGEGVGLGLVGNDSSVGQSLPARLSDQSMSMYCIDRYA